MAYAHVQTVVGNGAAQTVTSTTAGNLLVLGLMWSDSAGTNPTPTAGFVAADTKLTDGSNYSTQSFYYPNNAGGLTSIGAASWDNGTPGELRSRVSEYSGIATSSPLIVAQRQVQTNPGTGTDAVTSGTASVGTVPALIWGASDAPGLGTSIAAGTGFVSRGTDDGGRIEDRRETSASSYAATFTAGADPGRVHSWMLAFAEAVAGDVLMSQICL